MEQRLLEVTVVSATDLNNVNLIDNMDVYIIIGISGDTLMQAVKTPVDRSSGCNPCWNFKTQFIIIDEVAAHQNIVFKVKCERLLGDKVIGEVRLPIYELLLSPEAIDGKKTIVSHRVKKPDGRFKGFIKFAYQFGVIVKEEEQNKMVYPTSHCIGSGSASPPSAPAYQPSEGGYPLRLHLGGYPQPSEHSEVGYYETTPHSEGGYPHSYEHSEMGYYYPTPHSEGRYPPPPPTHSEGPYNPPPPHSERESPPPPVKRLEVGYLKRPTHSEGAYTPPPPHPKGGYSPSYEPSEMVYYHPTPNSEGRYHPPPTHSKGPYNPAPPYSEGESPPPPYKRLEGRYPEGLTYSEGEYISPPSNSEGGNPLATKHLPSPDSKVRYAPPPEYSEGGYYVYYPPRPRSERGYHLPLPRPSRHHGAPPPHSYYHGESYYDSHPPPYDYYPRPPPTRHGYPPPQPGYKYAPPTEKQPEKDIKDGEGSSTAALIGGAVGRMLIGGLISGGGVGDVGFDF